MSVATKGEFLGHPKGLYYLFFTEMWERFSFYGMRALLVYYMMDRLLFSQEHSSQIYGLYTGLVYMTPFIGGIIADRYLGRQLTVMYGGLLMMIGHFMMAFEFLFFPALFFLILGNGAFKPNISSQVGGLYEQGDHRRDGAFSIFYMGINLGAMLSPLVCGTIGEVYGWHYGFATAGLGMLLGLIVYYKGKKYLAPDNIMLNKSVATSTVKEPLTSVEIKRIWALAALCALNIVFWGVYEQQGNTLALWAQNQTERHVFGGLFEIPASWFQAINPFFILLFSPMLVSFWRWQDRRGKEPSSVAKMGIGSLLLGLSFLIMIPAARIVDSSGIVSAWWLIACIAVLTIGEIYLSPIGLSLVTKVAPLRMVSMMMGMWFLSSFVGNYLSGYIGTFWEQMSKESFFTLLIVLSFITATLFFILLKPLKKALHSEDI